MEMMMMIKMEMMMIKMFMLIKKIMMMLMIDNDDATVC